MKRSGDRVGRYVVEAPLGAGGMGEVYEARDTRLGRRVALKVLRSDAEPSANQRLLREARAAAAFEHPNAVVVYDAGEDGGEMYIAMELIRGRPLRAYVGDQAVPIRRRLRWMVDAARALGAAHRAGLIHRDIKPDNIVVREDGAIKVLDFGIARIREVRGPSELGELATLTAEGTIVGTPSYWAPEQLRGEEMDARADQFAWAVTAYELLCGAPPWSAPDPLALLSRILTTDPPPLLDRVPDLPVEVDAALLRALEKQAGDRFASIDDAADAIAHCADGGGREEPRSAPGSPRPVAPALTAPSPAGSSPGASRGGTEAVSTVAAPEAAHTPRAAAASCAGATTEASEDTSKTDGGCCAPTDDGGFARGATRSVAGVTSPARRRLSARWIRPLAAFALIGAAAGLGVGVLGGEGPTPGAPQAEPAAPLVVRTLDCEAASLEGSGATPELAAAIGVGACARLAVEVGMEWVPPGHAASSAVRPPDARLTLRVEARLSEGRDAVTLSIGERRSTAEGPTPMDAIVSATAMLSKQLAPPPRTPAEIAAWGAKDDAGARRIERVWGRMLLDLEHDDQAASRELLASDPDSAWSHYIAFQADVGGPAGRKAAAERVLALANALPPARAKILLAITPPDPAKVDEHVTNWLQMLREAYAEAPDDPVVVTAASRGITIESLEEGLAMMDRLYERFPAHSVFPIQVTIADRMPFDEQRRRRKYVERLWALLPESRTWLVSVRELALSGSQAEARRAVAMGTRLGLDGRASGNYYAQTGRVWLELTSLDPAAAREVAMRMLGVPRNMVTGYGSQALVASFQMEGRLAEAQSLRLREMQRFRAAGMPHATVYAIQDILERLALGQALPSAESLSWVETLPDKYSGPRATRLALALARMAADPAKERREAERVLREVEAAAAADAAGDPLKRDSLLVATVPAVLWIRGDADAAKRWREASRASFWARRDVAFFAALALEATGDAAEAERAYRLAMDPHGIHLYAFTVMAARVRLAALYRAQGRQADAATLEAEVDRVWKKADPGLREQILALRSNGS